MNGSIDTMPQLVFPMPMNQVQYVVKGNVFKYRNGDKGNIGDDDIIKFSRCQHRAAEDGAACVFISMRVMNTAVLVLPN